MSRFASYNGREYRVLGFNRRHGRRKVRLQFVDNPRKTFWVDAHEVHLSDARED